MKLIPALAFTISVLTFGSAVQALARVGGTEVGNGGDNLPQHYNSAWFVGPERTIRACITKGSDFAGSEADLARVIQSAFTRWTSYIHTKRVYEVGFTFEAEEGDPQTATLRFAEKLDLQLSCRGGEDLSFYFGRVSGNFENIRRQYADPVSFVHRESYDPARSWSKGLVWVNSQGLPKYSWATPHLLESILIHEIGHLFGVPHVPDTIMSEKFVAEAIRRLDESEYLISKDRAQAERARRNLLTKIDTDRQLFACHNCDQKFVDMRANTEETLGNDKGGPTQKVTCEMKFHNRFNWDFRMQCSDSYGRPLWTVVPTSDPNPTSSSIEVFKRLRVRGKQVTSESVEALNGQMVMGRLTSNRGKTYSVLLEKNLNVNSPSLVISILGGGHYLQLFHSGDVTAMMKED